MSYKYRAGDVVTHVPSREKWVLACDEDEQAMVTACGWPESRAYASDCRLRHAATESQRKNKLREVAKSRGERGSYSYRASLAAAQLAALETER